MTARWSHAWGRINEGLRHYREGDFSAAVSSAAEAQNGEQPDVYCKPASLYLQAAAHVALQQHSEAKAAFQRAEELTAAIEPGVLTGWEWRDFMWLQILRAEAAAAFGGSTDSKSQPSSSLAPSE